MAPPVRLPVLERRNPPQFPGRLDSPLLTYFALASPLRVRAGGTPLESSPQQGTVRSQGPDDVFVDDPSPEEVNPRKGSEARMSTDSGSFYSPEGHVEEAPVTPVNTRRRGPAPATPSVLSLGVQDLQLNSQRRKEDVQHSENPRRRQPSKSVPVPDQPEDSDHGTQVPESSKRQRGRPKGSGRKPSVPPKTYGGKGKGRAEE